MMMSFNSFSFSERYYLVWMIIKLLIWNYSFISTSQKRFDISINVISINLQSTNKKQWNKLATIYSFLLTKLWCIKCNSLNFIEKKSTILNFSSMSLGCTLYLFWKILIIHLFTHKCIIILYVSKGKR